jgi:nitroreductase
MSKIIDDLNWRYATKTFDSSKNISEADLEKILEAFRLSASSFGLQPWKLFVVKDSDKKQALLEHSWFQKQVVDAPLHLVFARNNIDNETLVQEFINDISITRNVAIDSLEEYKQMMLGFLSRMSVEEKNIWANKQIYIALGNIMTVLAEMKIDSCAMEGIVPSKYDEILGLTEK